MPKYFFHSEDSQLELDEDGTELADPATARLEGVRFAGSLLRDRAQALWEATDWRLIITDESKTILFTIEVTTKIGSAMMPWSARGLRAA